MLVKEFCKKVCPKYVTLSSVQLGILEEFYTGYRELIAILGRRSGKDLLTSIIALKETHFLLSLDDPFKHYNLAPGNPIYILLMACSSDQSRILFMEYTDMLRNSGLFKGRIDKIESDRICLLTDADIKYNKTHKDKRAGSVVVMEAHCNSDGLLGKRIFALFLNEAAAFERVQELDRTYNALTPATVDFKNSNGRLDSKIITITSPRMEGDFVHKLFTEASLVPSRLAVRHPSWEVNPKFTEKSLRHEFKMMSDDEFRSEFGAEFIPFKGNQTVSLRLSSNTIDALKRLARKKAFEKDLDITYNDIVRIAIEEYLVQRR